MVRQGTRKFSNYSNKMRWFFFYNYVCVFNCFVVINLSIHISSLNSGADRLDCYRMNVETYLTQQCTSNWRGYNCMRFISHSVFLCKFIKKKNSFQRKGVQGIYILEEHNDLFLNFWKNVSFFIHYISVYDIIFER